jgi:hypothetical protein
LKKILITTLCFTLLILISLVPVAFAATSLESIHSAKNITQLDTAMGDVSELKDEVKRMNEVESFEKNRILTGLMIRKNYQEDVASFKELFEAEYTAATTYAKFEEGYPYTTGASGNGAYLVVKTDMDCYVYVVAMPENTKGGLTSEYDLKMFYRADNNQYKKKVWVQGGLETRIAVSCAAWGNGQEYRIYTCLDVDGNKSAFCKANYRVNDYRYDWRIQYLYTEYHSWWFGYTSWYDFDFLAYAKANHSAYLTCDDVDFGEQYWGLYEGEYDSIGEYQDAYKLFSYQYTDVVVVHTTVTFKDGTTCHDKFYLPAPTDIMRDAAIS